MFVLCWPWCASVWDPSDNPRTFLWLLPSLAWKYFLWGLRALSSSRICLPRFLVSLCGNIVWCWNIPRNAYTIKNVSPPHPQTKQVMSANIPQYLFELLELNMMSLNSPKSSKHSVTVVKMFWKQVEVQKSFSWGLYLDLWFLVSANQPVNIFGSFVGTSQGPRIPQGSSQAAASLLALKPQGHICILFSAPAIYHSRCNFSISPSFSVP